MVVNRRPSSGNFNEQRPPDYNPQAVTERPLETESIPPDPISAPDSLRDFNSGAPQSYIENPYVGQPRTSFGTEPPVLTPEEYRDIQRRNLDMKDPSDTIRRRNKIVVGLIGATGILAAVAGAYFVGRGSDTAKALDEYRAGFPPSPPAATAPEVPGETRTGGLHKEMSLTDRQEFLHAYAERHLSEEDLQRFEGIAALPTSGSEFLIPGSTKEKSREALLWYDSVIFDAIGDQVAADYNIAAKESGYPEMSSTSVKAFKDGFAPDQTPDPKVLMDVFRLKIAAATSPYVTFADGIKILNGASSTKTINTPTAQTMRDSDEMLVSKTEDVNASEVFQWNAPHILALKPGISYKEGAPIMVVQFTNTDGATGTARLQETFRLEKYKDSETGITRMTPITESQFKGGRMLDGGDISFITDLGIFSK